MYQFFVEPEQIGQDKTVITGSDVNHIGNVLRMKPGEKIRISTGNGTSYFCQIAEIGPESVTADILSMDAEGTELPNEITLYQGLPKGDKMELIIQKAVELGAARIVPVAMKNCVVKLEPKKAAAKQARWQAIAESAAKQSKRTRIPEVSLPISFQEAMRELEAMDVKLVPYENAKGLAYTRQVFGQIQKGQSIGILIGPEGGIAPGEIQEAGQKEMACISLGKRILRTETAGLATLAMLTLTLEE